MKNGCRRGQGRPKAGRREFLRESTRWRDVGNRLKRSMSISSSLVVSSRQLVIGSPVFGSCKRTLRSHYRKRRETRRSTTTDDASVINPIDCLTPARE